MISKRCINDLPRPSSTLTGPLCILMIFLDLTRHLLDRYAYINDFVRSNSTLTRPLCILMIFLDLTRHLLDRYAY